MTHTCHRNPLRYESRTELQTPAGERQAGRRPGGLRLRKARRAIVSGWTLSALLLIFGPSVARGEWAHFANHSDIRALYEAGDTLWVGTGGGLVLVSVLTGDVVSTVDVSGGLPSNSVRVLYASGETIYVGTDGGLAACRRGRDGAISCEPAGPYPDIRHVSIGPSGTLYIGTFGHGVAQVQGGRAVWVTAQDSLLSDKVYAVQEAEEGTVLYATSMGLCARTSEAWVSFQAGAGLPRGEVRGLAGVVGRSGPRGVPREFYALVGGRGVYLFDGRRARKVSPQGLFSDDDVAAIAAAGDGTLWAAGRYGKLGRYRSGVWEEVGEKEGEITNALWRCVHVGKRGNVYFGSAEGLVVGVSNRGIRKVSIPSELPAGAVGPMVVGPTGRLYVADGAYLLSHGGDEPGFAVEKDFGSVLAIAVSPDSAMWIIGRWGLYRSEAGRWVEVTPDIDPKPPLFRSLAFDPSGHLWVGSESGEIFKYDGDLWVRYAERGELSEGPIDRVIVDRRGAVWALSDSGVYRFDGVGWAGAGIAGLDSTGIVELAADPAGEPVLLTREHVWRFSDVRGWQRVRTGGADAVGEYRAIGFDRRGRPYLATEQGIGLLDGSDFRWIGPRDGLRGREATSIVVDGDGYLWVGFRRDGLTRILLENP